jgi:transposase
VGAAVKITRTDHTAAALRGLAAKSSDAAQVRRLLALSLILQGRSRREAAEQAGMDRQTLRDWVHRYNAEGVPGLTSIRIGGHPASLNKEQMAELKAVAIEGPDPAKDKVVRWRCVDLREARRFVSVWSATRQRWRAGCLVRRSGGVTLIQAPAHAFKVPRQQLVHASDRMISDTSEDFAQIVLGIEPVQFGRLGQGEDRRGALPAGIRSRE